MPPDPITERLEALIAYCNLAGFHAYVGPLSLLRTLHTLNNPDLLLAFHNYLAIFSFWISYQTTTGDSLIQTTTPSPTEPTLP